MLESIATVAYICLCILFFSLAIAIHEFGHFIVALKLGLRVERFSIGFGPALWKKTWRGVEYRLSCIPFGGYVMIPDLDPEGTKAIEGGGSEKKEKIPAWKEILVALAGPGMNIVLAVVLAVGLSLVPNARFGTVPTVIEEVLPGGPAERAGIQAGDRIVSVAGRPVSTWSQMQTEIQIVGDNETPFGIVRDGEEITLAVKPERESVTGAVLIKAVSVRYDDGKPGTWLPSRNPWKQLTHDAGAIFRVLRGLVTPKEMKETGKALGGPVNIAQAIYYSMRADFWNGVGFLRFLNVNLAILNLLPIPVLDGGLILFALIALVFRRRVPEKVVGSLSMAFMCILLMLMLFLVYRDSARAWRIHRAVAEAQEEALPEGSAADLEAAEAKDADTDTDKGAEGR